jgi:predicted DNA-binding transcriptional regulator YafY
MRRADRLFHLVQLLRTQRFRTASAIAAELDVSVRTVYRDVQDLQAHAVPIEGEAGVGYRLLKGFELPPLTFREDELEALVLGARMVQAWGDDELASAARLVLTKIEAVLPEPLRPVLLRTALFAPAFPSQQAMRGELGPLRRAISDRRKIHFGYTREDGEVSARTVRPLGLYFWGNRWSLAAYCELRGDYRNFRPDRMRELQVLLDGFDGSDGIDLDAFVRSMKAENEPAPSPG